MALTVGTPVVLNTCASNNHSSERSAFYRIHRSEITFDSSYPTGGEDLVATTSLGVNAENCIVFTDVSQAGAGATITATYLPATGKLLAYAAAAQIANAVDLSACKVQIITIGTAA